MSLSETVSAEERGAVRDAARLTAPDRYLAALLAPARARDDLVALSAYLGEIARVSRTASEPTLGLMRLAWWRNAIEEGYGGARAGSPVAEAVVAAARRHDIPRDLLLAPLEGRVRELEVGGIADEAAFDGYLAETEGAALRLSLAMLGVPPNDVNPTLVHHAAGALGRLEAVRALPLHLSHGRLPLPPERLDGDDPRRLADDETARETIERITRRLVSEVEGELALSRVNARTAGPQYAPALLPLALVGPYLRALQSPRRDPMREIADISPLTRVARLWVASWRGRF